MSITSPSASCGQRCQTCHCEPSATFSLKARIYLSALEWGNAGAYAVAERVTIAEAAQRLGVSADTI